MVGDRDELARRGSRPRFARREHRHHETDDGAARSLREEREERALERRGRAQLLPRELEQPSAWEQGAAGGAARRAGDGQDERDGLACHGRSAAVAGEARLERLDGVDRRGVDAVQQREVAAHVVAELHEGEEPREP